MPTYINAIKIGSRAFSIDGLHAALPDIIVSNDNFVVSMGGQDRHTQVAVMCRSAA